MPCASARRLEPQVARPAAARMTRLEHASEQILLKAQLRLLHARAELPAHHLLGRRQLALVHLLPHLAVARLQQRGEQLDLVGLGLV